MNEVQDHAKIDIDKCISLAKNGNLAIKEKLKSEIINRLRDMGRYFKFRPDNFQLESFAERLITYNITEYALSKATTFCINNSTSFPSFSEFYGVVRGHIKPSSSNPKEDTYSLIESLESTIEAQIEAKFYTRFKDRDINDFCKWYVKGVMQLDMNNGFVSDPTIFKRNALFDWHDCYYRFDVNAMRKVYLEKLDLKDKKRAYLKNHTDIPENYIKICDFNKKVSK